MNKVKLDLTDEEKQRLIDELAKAIKLTVDRNVKSKVENAINELIGMGEFDIDQKIEFIYVVQTSVRDILKVIGRIRGE